MRLTLRPLLAISLLLPFAACPALAASIGSFALNGKNVQLTCATLVPMPGTDGVMRMVLVLSEKSPKPGVDANTASMQGELGASLSAVLLKFEGENWESSTGFSYTHPDLKKPSGYCDASACKLERIEVNGGEFSAHLVAEPVAGSSGNALAFDMNLRVKMP